MDVDHLTSAPPIDPPAARRVSLLSVIIPTKDRAPLLADQLQGFAVQTYEGPWELIVVDNWSHDATSHVVAELATRIPVRLVHTAGPVGASYARNVGARAARGDFLLFVDDDDRVTPGWLAAMAAAAEHADIVRGSDRLFHRDADGVERYAGPGAQGLHRPFGFLPSISGANSGLRKDLFDAVGGFRERYRRLEDTDLFWRAQLACPTPPQHVPDAVLEYRLRSGMRAVWRQAYSDNKAVPALYRDFRSQGMTRPPLANMLRGWKRLVVHGPRWMLSYRGREQIAEHAGWLLGLIVGSIRERVFYL